MYYIFTGNKSDIPTQVDSFSDKESQRGRVYLNERLTQFAARVLDDLTVFLNGAHIRNKRIYTSLRG